MLNESIIVKLANNILKRFEHNIDNGVLFLYNVETEEIWIGNESSNDIIKLIDGKKSLKEIYSSLMSIFKEYEYLEVKESFDAIVNDLINKNFLEV